MSESALPKPNARKPRWRRWLLELGLIVLVLVGIQWWQTRGAPSGPAPHSHGDFPARPGYMQGQTSPGKRLRFDP